MKVMVVGGGAREHTLVWKLSLSKKVEQIYVAPGNAGTARTAVNLDISPTNLDALVRAATENKIDLVVVGPEAPLAAGIVDKLQSLGIPAFGPTKEAALIESSKVFAKRLMQKYGIPCAKDAVFASFKEAAAYVKEQRVPLVIKADGLAAGKGAIVAQSKDEALKALSDIMEKRVFGDAGNQVLVEECLVGQETSLLAFTDGVTVVPMVTARDYKRAYDNDQGQNTGGMGCYSPSIFLDKESSSKAIKTIMEPVVKAMAQEGNSYKGALYAGLMLTQEGPKVLEFNARFGDPETQVQLPLLKTDLVDIMMAVIYGNLAQIKVEWNDGACVGVVMASGGYPGSYRQGLPITGLDKVDSDILIFHAGTKLDGEKLYTAGGRVLTVVARGKSVAEAREKVYLNLPHINFENCHYRKDIAAEEG
jgi:phosphoribosylamine--glycine ligase